MTKRISLLLLGSLGAFSLAASDPEHSEKRLGPRDVLWRLRQGNQAYVAGRVKSGVASPARRASLVSAQHPHAVVLTCADSRVPPEYIFEEGLGSLFVVRVAGLVADPVVVGSVEYAAEHLHTPLIVVMGHTRCGAVKAALETPAPPAKVQGPGANIEAILALLRPGIPKGEPQGDPWRTAVFGGVEQSVEDMMKLSALLPEMEKAGHVGVVGAVYELESGKVIFSDMLPPVHDAGEKAHLLHWARTPAKTPSHTAAHAH